MRAFHVGDIKVPRVNRLQKKTPFMLLHNVAQIGLQ